MGVLVLNSSSFSETYDYVGDFCEAVKGNFKLITKMYSRGYIVYKDLCIDDLEIIKGVLYKDVFQEIKQANFDSVLKSQLLSSMSKISDDDTVFKIYEQASVEFPKSVFYNEDYGLSLAYLNDYSLFSLDNYSDFCEYKLQVRVDNMSHVIFNVFDEKSFNTIALLEDNQSFKEYFSHNNKCDICDSTNLDAFDNLLKDQKLVVIDKLYFELEELTNACPSLPYNRVDGLKGLIPGGFEYRLHLNSNTAYRIYYHIANGKIEIITDSNKKDNGITSIVSKRIQRIFRTFG